MKLRKVLFIERRQLDVLISLKSVWGRKRLLLQRPCRGPSFKTAFGPLTPDSMGTEEFLAAAWRLLMVHSTWGPIAV